MIGRPKFDEVMIVNPSNGNVNTDQRVRIMRFHNIYPPEVSGFAQPEPVPYAYYGAPSVYGYYGQPEPYGYFAQEDPAYGGMDPTYAYGEVEPMYGYYGDVDPSYGYYAQVDPSYGYYAQAAEPNGSWEGYGYAESEPYQYADPGSIGYYGEEYPVPHQNLTNLGQYGQEPETAGYSQPPPLEGYPTGYYGEPEYSGYTREMSPPFNAGCPLPINVSGFEDGFAGYSRPATVNPSCEQFTEQPGSPAAAPDTFRPLW